MPTAQDIDKMKKDAIRAKDQAEKLRIDQKALLRKRADDIQRQKSDLERQLTEINAEIAALG